MIVATTTAFLEHRVIAPGAIEHHLFSRMFFTEAGGTLSLAAPASVTHTISHLKPISSNLLR